MACRSHTTVGWTSFGVGVFSLGVLSAGFLLTHLVGRVSQETRPFDIDEAAHAVPALELTVAAQGLEPKQVFRAVVRQCFYPPVHSVTVLASYLVAGPSLASTRMPTVVMYGISLGLLILLTFRVSISLTGDLQVRRAVALSAAAWALWTAVTSPVLIQNSVLSMLEFPGCLLTMVILLVCNRRGSRLPEEGKWVGLLAILLSALFLTKYVWGVIVSPAIVAAMITGQRPWKVPRVEVIMAGLLTVAVSSALLLWLLVTDARCALGFVANPGWSDWQSVPIMSIRNLAYYPKVWITDYSSHPVIGVGSLIFAAIGAVRVWRKFSVRASAWIVLSALSVLTIYQNNQERYFLIAAFPIFFLSGIGLSQLASLFLGTGKWIQRTLEFGVAGLFGLCLFVALFRWTEVPAQLSYAFEGRPINGEIQDFIVDHIDPRRPVLVLGSSDRLNVVMMSWSAAVKNKIAPSETEIHTQPAPRAFEAFLGGASEVSSAGAGGAEPRLADALSGGYYGTYVEIRNSDDLVGTEGGGDQLWQSFSCRERSFEEWLVRVCDLDAPSGRGG